MQLRAELLTRSSIGDVWGTARTLQSTLTLTQHPEYGKKGSWGAPERRTTIWSYRCTPNTRDIRDVRLRSGDPPQSTLKARSGNEITFEIATDGADPPQSTLKCIQNVKRIYSFDHLPFVNRRLHTEPWLKEHPETRGKWREDKAKKGFCTTLSPAHWVIPERVCFLAESSRVMVISVYRILNKQVSLGSKVSKNENRSN